MTNPALEIRLKAQQIWPGANIHARGKNWIRHQHPSDPNRFMLDVNVGPLHYGLDQEIDTAWQPSSGSWIWEMIHADFNAYLNNGSYRYVDVASGEYVNLDVTALEWRNDANQAQNIPLVTVNPSATDDIVTWNGLFGAGTQFQIQAQTARLAKFFRLNSNSSLPVPTIGGTNIQLVFRFRLQHSNSVDVYIDGVQWDEHSRVISGNVVEFRSVTTGITIWSFKVPVAWDSSVVPSLINGTQVFNRSGNNLFVEACIPYSWLSSAIYPVVIDPTIDSQVGAGADDGTWWATLFNNTNTYTDLGNNTVPRNSFHRFTGISLDGTVDVSYISVKSFADYTTSILLKIRADDEDNPTAPTSNADAAGRSQTAAGVDWDTGSTFWGSDNWYNSPSINSVIQELIDSYTISNDAIQIFVLDDGTATDVVRFIYTYNSNSTYGVKLHIEYTSGGTSVSVTDSGTIDEAVTIAIVPPVGSTCWGQITGVTQTNIRTFLGNWGGDWGGNGTIENTLDDERIAMYSGQFMLSEVINTGPNKVTIKFNQYKNGDYPSGGVLYRTGSTIYNVLHSAFQSYTGEFTSLGYVQIEIFG